MPFRHGPMDVVKYSATPISDNPACPLLRSNPKGLQDELVRHLKEDGKMSSFEFGVQFLDTDRMTYWGKHQDTNFWIENASVNWKEAEAPFHAVGRLTLVRNSQLSPDDAEMIYFDVTGHSTPDSTPLGSINRARMHGELASREARIARTAAPNLQRLCLVHADGKQRSTGTLVGNSNGRNSSLDLGGGASYFYFGGSGQSLFPC